MKKIRKTGVFKQLWTEYKQWVGKCKACNEWNCIQEAPKNTVKIRNSHKIIISQFKVLE